MTHASHPPLEDFDLEVLVRLVREEVEALTEALPAALARQWEASPVPRPREDTTERATGERPSDPTASTALDPRRIAVRETVLRAEEALRGAAVTVRGVRRGLEIAVARFDGDHLEGTS